MKKLFNLTTVLVIINSAMYLSSCGLFTNTNQFAKQQLHAQEFYLQYPGELAKVCAQKFPVTFSKGVTSVDSSHLAFNQNYEAKIDSLKSLADMAAKLLMKTDMQADNMAQLGTVINGLQSQVADFKNKYKPCKHDTLYLTNKVPYENKAVTDSLRNFIDQQKTQVAKLQQLHVDDQATIAAEKHSAMVRLWICIGFGLLILILVVILIEKII